jgi:aminomethyltransferase
MKYSLYGHEISEETNPYEAGLGWVVKMGDENNFYGKDLLAQIKKAGIQRRLVGFRMLDRAIPRQGYAIVMDGKTVGQVTSGTMSPSLDIPIGIGFVPPDMREVGTRLHIDIRGKLREAEVVETPFYNRDGR